MLANAIQKLVTQARITFRVFTGSVLCQQVLNELQYRQDQLLNHGAGGVALVLEK